MSFPLPRRRTQAAAGGSSPEKGLLPWQAAAAAAAAVGWVAAAAAAPRRVFLNSGVPGWAMALWALVALGKMKVCVPIVGCRSPTILVEHFWDGLDRVLGNGGCRR